MRSERKKAMYYFNFIKGTSGISAQNGVEYDITQSLNKIQNKEVKKIALKTFLILFVFVFQMLDYNMKNTENI